MKRGANESDIVRTVHVNAFNESKVLNLRPNKDIARNVPVYYAEHDPKKDKVVVKPAPEVRIIIQ